MNNYKIFKNSFDNYEAVKQGWSWPAFFFDLLWVLIKQLWLIAGIIFMIMIVLMMFLTPHLQGLSNEETTAIMNSINLFIGLPLKILLGFFGNKLREQNLTKRGYTLVATVSAPSPSKAIEQRKGNSSFLDM